MMNNVQDRCYISGKAPYAGKVSHKDSDLLAPGYTRALEYKFYRPGVVGGIIRPNLSYSPEAGRNLGNQ